MITFFSLIINKGRKASKTLTWPQRLQILSDAAQGNERDNIHFDIIDFHIWSWNNDIIVGILYLHDGCNIIHRDVKTSNILLSTNLEGKMSDFGISKFTSNDASNATTRIVGTMGYLDPE